MKVLKFLAVAMLFAMVGINFELQAANGNGCSVKTKKQCKASDNCAWAGGMCSSKKSKASVAVGQAFTPDTQFAGSGLVGSYDSSTQTAKISDPSGKSSKSYNFINVQSTSTMARPVGLTKIGTFPTPNFVQSKYSCSGCPTRTTTLYGTLAS